MSDLIRAGQYEKLVVLELNLPLSLKPMCSVVGVRFIKLRPGGVSTALQEGQRNPERTEHQSLQATRDLSRLYRP
jgi:hypothetical protein